MKADMMEVESNPPPAPAREGDQFLHGEDTSKPAADMAIPTLVPNSATPPQPSPGNHLQHHDNPSLRSVQKAGDGDQPTNRILEARLKDGDEPPQKRMKTIHGEVEMVLRQTAEIVMVLVGMAALRGGAPPTPVECRLAAEAYEKLAALVEHIAPRDLVAKDSLQNLIQQLTVPPVPARPAAKPITIQQTPTPTPVPTLTPTPTPTPTPAAAAKAASTATAPALATKANLPDKRSSTPTNTAKSKPAGRTSPSSAPATRTKDTQTAPTTVTLKDQGGNQAPKALARQRGAKSGALQPMSDQQQTHQQLALAVQLLLKSSTLTQALPKAASAYMSPPVGCAICKLLVNDTNSVLVCDGCEAGFHLLCLQMHNSNGFPKNDWYCPKCEMASAGRPQPPKYGPLRRGHAAQSGPRNSWSMQGGRGNDSATGQTSGKPLLQLRKRDVEAGAGRDANEPTPSKAASLALDLTKSYPAEPPAKRPELQRPVDTPPEGQVIATASTKAASEDAMAQQVKDTGKDQGVSEQLTGVPSAAAPVQDTEAGASGKDGAGDDSIVVVDWVGPVVNVSQGNVYYAACSVAGVTMRLQDTAFFRPETTDVPPYIARLQALWEEQSSGQKWVKVNWCYYPTDLPVETGRPMSSDPKEVYESNHSDNNLVGSIQGPCLVLPPLQYRQETERRAKEDKKEDFIPIFLYGFMMHHVVYSELVLMQILEVARIPIAAACEACAPGVFSDTLVGWQVVTHKEREGTEFAAG